MEILFKTRTEIDGLLKLIPPIQHLQNSLRLSKSWTTKAILVLNPEDNTPDEIVINEDGQFTTIEFLLNSPDVWNKKAPIEMVELLIDTVQGLIHKLPDYQQWLEKFYDEHIYSKAGMMGKNEYLAFEEKAFSEVPNWQLELTQVYIHLTEVKMFLGWELLSLRKKL